MGTIRASRLLKDGPASTCISAGPGPGPSFGSEHRPFEWGRHAVGLCFPCLWWWGLLCRRWCAARDCARAVLVWGGVSRGYTNHRQPTHISAYDISIHTHTHTHIYLSILSRDLSKYPCIYPSIYLPVYLSIYQPTYLYIDISAYLPIYLSTYLCQIICRLGLVLVLG